MVTHDRDEANAGENGQGSFPPFTLFDHTADVGIIACGEDPPALFAHAGQALFAVMVDPDEVGESVCREIAVTAGDREALLVAWLNELLFVVDVERLVFKRFSVEEYAERHLRAFAFGERIDPARHQFKTAVKAATYHLLSIEEGPPWRAQVILDL